MDIDSNIAAEPSAQQIRATAAKVVGGSDYDLSVQQTDVAWINDLILTILRWIATPFRWVYELTEGLPDVMRWLILVILVIVLLLLTYHILRSIVQALGEPQRRGKNFADQNGRRRSDPGELEHAAAEAQHRGDFISAVRYLLRASVARLERYENKPYRPGTTNRELLRRYRNRPLISEPLRSMVEMVDAKWYGDDVCTETDFSACRSAHQLLCQSLTERTAYDLRT